MPQPNGFSPVWILMCAKMFPLQLKRFSQTEQLNGFSPVCVLMWLIRWSLRQNVRPHSEQLNASLSVFLISLRETASLLREFKWGRDSPGSFKVSWFASVSGSGALTSLPGCKEVSGCKLPPGLDLT